MNILVLATSKPSVNLIHAIESRGHTYEHFKPTDLYNYISESVNGYDRIYYAPPDAEKPTRLKLKEYDAIITRLGNDLQASCNILRHLNENLGIYSTQTANGLLTASDKLKTIQECSIEGVRVPRTVYAQNPTHVEFLVDKVGGLPAVAKTVRGSQGNGVFILRDVEQTNTSLQAIYNLKVDLLLQEYIEGDKKDIRAIVVGDKVAVAMERTGSKDFRANLSQKGGSGRKIELSKEDKDFCVKAAKAVGLEFAGVDIMKRKGDNTTFLIEVNGNPGTKSIGITKVNWFIDLVKYIEDETGLNAEAPNEAVSVKKETNNKVEPENRVITASSVAPSIIKIIGNRLLK